MNLKSIFKKDGELRRKVFQSLETEQQTMIQGVLDLPETVVKEIMVPRIDTVFLEVDASKTELLTCMADSGHSRFPVYEETIDNVIGILYVKDVLSYLLKDAEFDLRKIIRKPFFVPESKRIYDLLKELRHKRVHIAVVVDEYGGVSGIICMEDILEEIIGDIQDEFDNETPEILKLSEGTFLCDARINLDTLAKAVGIELPADDFDTLGGFVFDLFGKIPVKDEKLVYKGHDIIIQDMDGHKINTVKLILKSETPERDQ
ncbi:MAG: hemolysin family protein [Treponema sp.]|jgi:CBS domain containing-hemolysin-like protein|nr:hemolysin family protein [Treponema sp.]